VGPAQGVAARARCSQSVTTDCERRERERWVYSERNAVTHLPGLLPSCRVSCEQESDVSTKNQEKKEKVEFIPCSPASAHLVEVPTPKS
jgi:hypothetical protein